MIMYFLSTSLQCVTWPWILVRVMQYFRHGSSTLRVESARCSTMVDVEGMRIDLIACKPVSLGVIMMVRFSLRQVHLYNEIPHHLCTLHNIRV